MTSSSTPNPEPTLADVLRELSLVKEELAEIRKETSQNFAEIRQETTDIRQDTSQTRTELDQTLRWQDRTWDVVKWVGGISAGLAISASIALVGTLLKGSFGQ
jgi:chromosome segregation ATPase